MDKSNYRVRSYLGSGCNVCGGGTMKPITEELRQSLIEYGKLFNSGGPKGKAGLLIEIAIESLMAEPYRSRYRLRAKGNHPEIVWSSWFPGAGKALRKSHNVEVDHLYAAPPVPVIKLPEKYSNHEGFLTDTEQGYNDAIDEVASIINGLS